MNILNVNTLNLKRKRRLNTTDKASANSTFCPTRGRQSDFTDREGSIVYHFGRKRFARPAHVTGFRLALSANLRETR